MSAKYGIEETMDLIDFVEVLVEKLVSAKGDDGKIDGLEIASMVVTTMTESIAAMAGSDKIDDELKDLSDEERAQLVAKVMPILQKLVKSFWSK